MRSIMARAVRALRRKMLLQAQRTKGAQGVDGENLLWRPIREKRDRDRDQPANEVRVAVAAIVQDRLAVGARSRLASNAAPRLVAFIVSRPAKGLSSLRHRIVEWFSEASSSTRRRENHMMLLY